MNSDTRARNKFKHWISDYAGDSVTVEEVLKTHPPLDACWIGFWEGWKAALAAAPTPPAQPCVAPYKSHECKDCGKVIEQTPPAQEVFDECPASGFDHKFRNDGPNGEKQCEYCGEPPAQKDEPVAYIDIRGNFWSIERAKAELEDGNLIDLRPVYTRLDNSELRKAVQQMARALQAGEWAEHVNDSDPALAALEREITRLVGEVNGLRKAGELVIESFKESEQMMWSGALINLRAALNKRKS